MGMDLIPADEPSKNQGHTACAVIHELDRQRLRILRCTAHAMASSPGGLRFKAGTRPWLDGISGGRPAASRSNSSPRLHTAERPLAA